MVQWIPSSGLSERVNGTREANERCLQGPGSRISRGLALLDKDIFPTPFFSWVINI